MTTTQLTLARRIAAILAAFGFILGTAASAQAQTVRDHRDQPKVRDHRKPLTFCFGGPFGGTTCQNLRPQWQPRPR